jgi:D-alanyl-D-alanine carboxypeptidase
LALVAGQVASNAPAMLKMAAASAIGLALVACSPASRPAATLSPYGIGEFPALPTTELPEDMAAPLQAILDESLDASRVPGIAAAVIWAEHGTWVGAAGTADGEGRLDPAAQFGIGSVTKVVIAAQVLQLVESATVELDRPITDYIGEDVPTNGATVRHVLGMRSGIKEYTGDVRAICADLASTYTLADLRPALSDESIFEPGTGFRYTNANYLLAGLLIEEVTGGSVATALRSGVLADPGLERLIYQDEERPTAPLAAPFLVLPGSEPVPAPSELLRMGDGYLPARCLAATAGPAGGMASDPMTLARFGYLLYGGSVLGDQALAEMTTFEATYGLGTHDHGPQLGIPAVGHEGSVPGYTAQLIAFPEDGLAVAVLANTNGDEGAMTYIAGRLRDALMP